VLRETDPHATIWELLLSEVARRLPTELAAVEPPGRRTLPDAMAGPVSTSWTVGASRGTASALW
jgi:hypothetical protein